VNHEPQKHERIRFRRHEITDLAGMPSAAGQHRHWRPGSYGLRRAVRLFCGGLAGAAIVAGLFAGIVMLVGLSGWGSERLRAEAEKAIERVAGVPVEATIGPARLTLDGSRLIAIELNDVEVRDARSGAAMLRAGEMRFGIRLLPLLTGKVQLGSATIADARIDIGALPRTGGTDWSAILRDERGLVDPDRVPEVLFGQLNLVMNAVEAGQARTLDLANVAVIAPEGDRVHTLDIATASFAETAPGTLFIAVAAVMDGRPLTLEGEAVRDAATRRIASVDISLAGDALPGDTAVPPRGSVTQLGGFSVALKGGEGDPGKPATLGVVARMKQSVLDLGARGAFVGDMDLDMTFAEGSRKVEINSLRLVTGRNSLEFNGAIGPRPPGERANDVPAYRYELVSTRTVVAPEGSPEPALDFRMRIAGIFDPLTRILSADDIAVKSGPGEALGTARVTFVEGKAPGIALALELEKMQVAHVKQLWPFFSGPKARAWVFAHVFGGRVDSSRIEFRVEPGRLGNGVPLSAEEVSARFAISDTRFDTAGLIPPVRDASGIVEVHGNDFDVTLEEGTVYMPSGRTVAASNGRLVVKQANLPPVIGRLDIDIAGSADAVAELASYEPINAMKRVAMVPEEFSGTISGHVAADIPFQKSTDPRSLDWLVDLDFRALSISKPFDNQIFTAGEGNIKVSPDRAIIEAKAKLNGIPAEIDLLEPLRPEGPERQRKVSLILDDQARKTLAPGLAGLVTGPVKVAFDSGDGVRHIVADLSGARLDLPWVGWSKGAGVAASASFDLVPSGSGNITLSQFVLSGKSFSASGSVALAGGKLSSARFDSVQLNRGDDIAVTVKRSGGGYGVDIRGKSLDARPLIKKITGSGEAAGDAPSGGAAGTAGSVSLRLDVASLGGFNDETLSGVKLSYDGTGAELTGLSVSASTGKGESVTVTNDGQGRQRTLQLVSSDAGAILRFLDIYRHMQGGSIKLTLAGSKGAMKGQIDARNFVVVDEPKLASIVSNTPPGGGRSLSQAVRKDIDTSRVNFERGYAQIDKGDGYLKIANGVLRGPLIGSTFQGTLYDERGRMDMTGTFMPAYGLNRIFGELPLIGVILGNGRDRGLIGVTYKLDGAAKAPRLSINPLSAIAPGIFRSIFEFQ